MINDTTMRYSTKLLNGYGDASVCYTLLGIIINVEEEKYTVDVYIPKSNTNIYNVQIGTNMVGDDVSIDILPSLNQKCIILMSSMHHPILIAVIPNQRQEVKSLLLSGEVKIGSPEAFMKLSKDNTIGFRTNSSSLNISGNELESIIFSSSSVSPYTLSKSGHNNNGLGFSKSEIYNGPILDFFKSKDDIIIDGKINESVKEDIMSANISLISNLSDTVNKVSLFNDTVDMLGDDVLDKLEELRLSLDTKSDTDEYKIISTEYGHTDFNTQNDATMSIRGYNNKEESYSLIFKRDGTLNINCKDIIVNKTGGNDDVST